MKYDEFIKIMDKYDEYCLEDNRDEIIIKGKNLNPEDYLSISKDRIDLFIDMYDLDKHKLELIASTIELAKTPLEEREEKKYYLKLIGLDEILNNENYLNKSLDVKEFFIAGCEECNLAKTKFTQDEINEMSEKYGISLDTFEQIEV